MLQDIFFSEIVQPPPRQKSDGSQFYGETENGQFAQALALPMVSFHFRHESARPSGGSLARS